MPPHLLVLQMILVVAATSGSMLAATVDAPEDVPVPEIVQPQDPRWEVRAKRAEDFKSQFLLSRKSVEANHGTEKSIRKKRMDARRACRENVRKSNRDQRFSHIENCLSQDLALTIELVQARSVVVASAAGISKELRELIIARGELLIDAASTIIDALHAGVYQDEAELLEARSNLREKYLLPYWSLLPRMQADQTLAWVSHLLLRTKTLVESGGASEGIAAKLQEVQACLETVESALENSRGLEDSQEIHSKISQAQSDAESCIKLLEEASIVRQEELTPQPEAKQEPQWQKRSLRKLPKSRF